MEDFDLLLKRAGLKLAPEDAERLRLFFEKYQERLKVLNSADLGEEEVAGIFPTQWIAG